MIHALETARLVEQKSNISVSRFQMIPLQFNNQHLGDHQLSRRKISKIKKKFIINSMQKIKDFGEWLLNYIPPKPKLVDKVLEFQTTQSKSALKNFAIQYQIKGLNGDDSESFLLNSKLPISNLMISTRKTKVKLILSCMMEKVDLKSGEVIAKGAAFHSKTEVNLESTNSNELFSKMKKLFWSL